MAGPFGRTNAASETSHEFDELVDPDVAGARFERWFVHDVASDKTRRVRNQENTVNTPGYTPANGTIVTAAFPATIAQNAEMEMWRDSGVTPTPQRIKGAARRARRTLEYEDVHYFVTEPNQTVYPLPALIDDKAINEIQVNTSYLDQDYYRSAIVSARNGIQASREPFNWRGCGALGDGARRGRLVPVPAPLALGRLLPERHPRAHPLQPRRSRSSATRTATGPSSASGRSTRWPTLCYPS